MSKKWGAGIWAVVEAGVGVGAGKTTGVGVGKRAGVGTGIGAEIGAKRAGRGHRTKPRTLSKTIIGIIKITSFLPKRYICKRTYSKGIFCNP